MPNTDLPYFGYSDTLLGRIIGDENQELIISIINAPIEDNFYIRATGQKSAVISLYKIDSIIKQNNLKLEDFILINIFTLILFFKAEKGFNGYLRAFEYFHDDIRNCLFDFTGNKQDIIHSMCKPEICEDCKAKLKRKQLPDDLLNNINRELKKIKKPLYYRIEDWVKAHPIWSILFTGLFGLTINLISSFLWELPNSYLNDPLKIEGNWTYIVKAHEGKLLGPINESPKFSTSIDSLVTEGYLLKTKYRPINDSLTGWIKIWWSNESDVPNYKMDGFRTGIWKDSVKINKDSTRLIFDKYSYGIASEKEKNFEFRFHVDIGPNVEGYINVKFEPENNEVMNGYIDYLYPDGQKQRNIIIFTKRGK